MKNLFLVMLASILLPVSVFALGAEVAIDCELSQEQSTEVQKLTLNSETDRVDIQFRDGSVESLEPIEAANQGIFGRYNFTKAVSNGHGQVFVWSPRLGDVYLKHECFLSPRTPILRCTSQGNGKIMNYAGATLNMNGQLLRLTGKAICTRHLLP